MLIKDLTKPIYKTTLGEANDEVIIGSDKSASFVPQICFTRWNKENSLTIKVPDGLITNTTPTLSAGKLEIKDTKTGFYFNPDPDNSDNFKFGLILYEKPTTNTWSFQLEGWEDFDFFYQPPLKNVNPDGSTWEINVAGGYCFQPAKSNGSWCIYHKTKRDHIVGQTNYATGKLGVFYRIKFIDADGKWEWAVLDIKDGNYIILVSQDFLNSAKYPVKANDTFGNTTSPTNSSDSCNSYTIVCPVYQSTGSGTLTLVHCFVSNNDGVNPYAIKEAIYNDNGSAHPGTRLDAGATITIPAGQTEADLSGNAVGASIVTATQYWFAVRSSNSNVQIWRDGGVPTQDNHYNSDYTYAQFPEDPFGDAYGLDTYRYGLYATYTPSGGGAVYLTLQNQFMEF